MTSSLAFLGSKTGKEVGVCFWRVHPSLPRFTVVFKRVEERDNWCDSSQLLRDMVRSEGVRASRVFYDRELDQVVGGDGERERESPAKMRSDGNNNTVVDRKPESIKTFMMDELQDLDDIFLGNSTKGFSPPAGGVEAGSEVGRGAQDGDRQSPVSSGFGSSESDGDSTKDQNQSDPPPPSTEAAKARPEVARTRSPQQTPGETGQRPGDLRDGLRDRPGGKAERRCPGRG